MDPVERAIAFGIYSASVCAVAWTAVMIWAVCK
jgi:hypothetical protein